MKSSLLCIVGPTAVGKTDFFLKLIHDGFDFHAIIADSRQMYRYMDIGTGKDLPSDIHLKQKFWLIDSVDPDQSFSSANFYQLANQAIQQISDANHQPVIVGGTGRYIKDLQQPPETLTVPPNLKLRQQLSTFSVSELHHKLSQLNPQKLAAMNHSDLHNPRRLIRAIEVAGAKLSPQSRSKLQFHIICLSAPLQLIKARIIARTQKRIELGMLAEVQQLIKRYPDFSTYQASHTPGYQEIIQYLHHQISLNEAVENWSNREINYAKRQLTWFKHKAEATWFDIASPSWYAEAVNQLRKWNYVPSHS